MAHELPKLVRTVKAGVSRYLLLRESTTSGTEVETWPNERKGANRRPTGALALGGAVEVEVEATTTVCRDLLEGRASDVMLCEWTTG
ncbi:BQ5605_C039g11817 [Microbotryum silenes-dioicae]|uniref:BQ5605_C039g11817 protein n=1 Tax=Microbotryum silenes-dioicae TaxID=796604 RepID=A0A2X0MI24_9BASI|nr:BQ5605_C039g11817 [Microbotryum silenes-dioicae]